MMMILEEAAAVTTSSMKGILAGIPQTIPRMTSEVVGFLS
jgi:hypothetical protein